MSAASPGLVHVPVRLPAGTGERGVKFTFPQGKAKSPISRNLVDVDRVAYEEGRLQAKEHSPVLGRK